MKETLFNANGLDSTRIRRAFNWVVTFRDFPAGSYQTVDGDSMMTQALTMFTKGRAEFYLDGARRRDRVPGVLSSEHEIVGLGGEFKLVYTEPTTRLCIPAKINQYQLPRVRKIELQKHEVLYAPENFKGLVCLGSVQANGKMFQEEHTFRTSELTAVHAMDHVLLLEFL